MSFPYKLIVKWSPSLNCYIAKVPAFPMLMVVGDTLTEAVSGAENSAKMMIEALGHDAPKPDLT